MADMDEFEQLDDLNSEIRRLRRADQETRDRLVAREEVAIRLVALELTARETLSCAEVRRVWQLVHDAFAQVRGQVSEILHDDDDAPQP